MNQTRFFRLLVTIMLAVLMCGCGYTAVSLNKDVPIFKSPDPNYPRAIVVYDSWSGNTRIIAEVIAEKLMAQAVHIDQIKEYVLDDYDLIVVGSPVHGGYPTGKISDFLYELPKPPMSAVFVTFGAPLFGPLTANACLKKMEKKLQGTSLGKFKCHGFHKIFRTYSTHPDENDKADATGFAAELLNRCLEAEDSF